MEVHMLDDLIRKYDMVQVSGKWSITSLADIEADFNAVGIYLDLDYCSVDKEYAVLTGNKMLVYWLDAKVNSVWFRCELMDADEYFEAYEYEEESDFEEE